MLQKYEKFYSTIKLMCECEQSYDERRELQAYYNQKILEFMHERLVHLLVTIFVGIAMLLITAVIILGTILLLLPIEIMLIVLFSAYIWHYYQLENGLQKLYTLTEKLFPTEKIT